MTDVVNCASDRDGVNSCLLKCAGDISVDVSPDHGTRGVHVTAGEVTPFTRDMTTIGLRLARTMGPCVGDWTAGAGCISIGSETQEKFKSQASENGYTRAILRAILDKIR